jgi:antitoxin component of MazEF toxin-antitoxin module
MLLLTSMNKYIQIRKQGASLYLRLPASFVHDNGLNAGDWTLWEPENFKLLKQSTINSVVEPARVPEAASE